MEQPFATTTLEPVRMRLFPIESGNERLDFTAVPYFLLHTQLIWDEQSSQISC